MTRKEAIKEFCKLATKVNNTEFNGNMQVDCFCEESIDAGSFCVSNNVIEFIKTAVDLVLEQEEK